MLGWHITAKAHHLTRYLLACFGFSNGFWQHGHDLLVFTIQHHASVFAKDMRFGLRIGLHITMPIQMILGHVQYSGCSRLKSIHSVELKT